MNLVNKDVTRETMSDKPRYGALSSTENFPGCGEKMLMSMQLRWAYFAIFQGKKKNLRRIGCSYLF